MFHQERVSPQDTHALSFLWWPGGDFSKKPEDHQMFLNLFGARSSPSCSSLSLKKTTEDNKSTSTKKPLTPLIETSSRLEEQNVK